MRSVNCISFLNLFPNRAIADLRPQQSWQKAHIPGSISLPFRVDAKAVRRAYRRFPAEAFPWKEYILAPEEYIVSLRALHAEHGGLLLYDQEEGLAMQAIKFLLGSQGPLHPEPLALEGGYKAWKSFEHDLFSRPRPWIVLTGKTGSGKTELLRALGERGLYIVDWEQLYGHRGSAFGLTDPQGQDNEWVKRNLLQFLSAVPEHAPIVTEQKAALVGPFAIPAALWKSLRHAPHICLHRARNERIRHIVDTYGKLPLMQLETGLASLRTRLPERDFLELSRLLTTRNYTSFVERVLPYYDQSPGYGSWPGEPLADLDMDTQGTEQAVSKILALINSHSSPNGHQSI